MSFLRKVQIYFPANVYGKNIGKSVFRKLLRIITVKFCKRHYRPRFFKICSNDDPELSIKLPMKMSNLLPNAFICEKDQKISFSKTTAILHRYYFNHEHGYIRMLMDDLCFKATISFCIFKLSLKALGRVQLDFI